MTSRWSSRATSRALATLATPVVPLTRPQVTGAGPFRAYPKFAPLGEPSTLLSISIPQSSQIYISQSTIVGLNGHLENIRAETRSVFGAPFQRLQADGGASNVVVSGRSNYTVLDVADNWTVHDTSRIIGWAGDEVRLTTEKSVTQNGLVRFSGFGSLVIDGDSEIFKMDVRENEEVYLNPRAFIAVGRGATKEGVDVAASLLPYAKYELHTLDLQHFHWPRAVVDPVVKLRRQIRRQLAAFNKWQKSYQEYLLPYLTPMFDFLGRVAQSIYNYVNGRLIRRKPIYVKIQGPCSVLLDNHRMFSNNKVFTNAEIDEVFK
ncbi:uncharacterized protein LODBEIA_P51090 [Lodderomyces beijingensis]|uniref:Altered inheritance of mitochondria protein 24, mitochondrial n=1 Tax=Lodderomyces beijingensis TaxID=1775926 RepID=A0ABP0ZRW0_9ASCO